MSIQNTYGFLALALRQANITRWSLMRCSQRESVLEHSAVVTMLSFLIAQIANKNGRNVSLEKMMGFAISHDISEVITGDLVTPVKHANEKIESEFRNLEIEAEKCIVSTLPEFLQGAMNDALEVSGYERVLVKACDIYAAYIKCITEIEAGNRIEFEDARSALRSTLDEYGRKCPEIIELDELFTAGFSFSVDKLLRRS